MALELVLNLRIGFFGLILFPDWEGKAGAGGHVVSLISDCTLIRLSGWRVVLLCSWSSKPCVIYDFTWDLLKLALERVFSWGKGSVNYLFLTELFPKNFFVPKMYFFARHKLRLILGLSHQLKEEIFAKCVFLRLRK